MDISNEQRELIAKKMGDAAIAVIAFITQSPANTQQHIVITAKADIIGFTPGEPMTPERRLQLIKESEEALVSTWETLDGIDGLRFPAAAIAPSASGLTTKARGDRSSIRPASVTPLALLLLLTHPNYRDLVRISLQEITGRIMIPMPKAVGQASNFKVLLSRDASRVRSDVKFGL